ncbi:MAG: glutamine synthetase beta-grasp domain-containing protein [Myxococcales bacterium]|nr:glutamine synthetase beta-grasp domain-containing protein [Myxococcales bacterium]
MPIFAEYIWIDGVRPTATLRSKTKVIYETNVPSSTLVGDVTKIDMNWFPEWGADGSSTEQAAGRDSDIVLKPVSAVRDPFRKGHYLVMTEVFVGATGEPHVSNRRSELRKVLDLGAARADALFGFEQEYTFVRPTGRPLGFPDDGYPAPQGPYYCAVGVQNIVGRPVYEAFMQNCLDAGVHISGVNWEVMPGQAEVQVGPVGPLMGGDHVWFARWILQRTGEEFGVGVSFAAKPAKGDWNGAGMHTNFSTGAMRAEGGIGAIEDACMAIGKKAGEHLAVYGDRYEDRLTGAHETAHYSEFRYGVSDRTASIRIPRHVAEQGHGYLEDRRPNANADPYQIASRLLRTVCGID